MSQYCKEAPDSIQEMFGTIAKQYDRANSVMSLRMHHYWNQQLVQHLSPSKRHLDICCGTGEIAFGFLEQPNPPEKSQLLDFCEEMLACAREKSKKYPDHPFHFIQADAQEIPLGDACVDRVTVAYGIRNVKDPRKCAAEVYRVLEPGGQFGILELTRPNHALLRFGHRLYMHTVLPTVGRLVSANQEAYQYLCNSIQNFVSPTDLAKMLEEVGFKEIEVIPLMGGVATIIRGQS